MPCALKIYPMHYSEKKNPVKKVPGVLEYFILAQNNCVSRWSSFVNFLGLNHASQICPIMENLRAAGMENLRAAGG